MVFNIECHCLSPSDESGGGVVDWKRARTIFIFLLIALNLFLFVTLFYNGSSSVLSAYEERSSHLLDSRGIQFAGKWPDAPNQANQILFDVVDLPVKKMVERLMPGASLTTLDNGAKEYRSGNRVLATKVDMASGYPETVYVDSTAGYQIDLSDEKTQEKSFNNLFREMGVGSYNLVLDRKEIGLQSKEIYYYVQPADKGILFDNKVVVTLRDFGVEKIVFSLYPTKLMPTTNSQSEDVLTAKQALVLSSIKGPMTIEKIDFGWGQKGKDELYFSPLWRFQYNNSKTLRIDAFTGRVLE